MKTILAKIPAGKNFTVWGREYTVLEQRDEGTFVLQNSIETVMPFMETKLESAPMNNFRYSDVLTYLDVTYQNALEMESADLSEDLFKFPVELTCTLGQHEYGTVNVKVGLLTLRQYGDYYDLIPKLDRSWWLATPYLTPSRSPFTNNTDYAWGVDTDGYGYISLCSNSYGVRPALTLNPLLLVAYNDGEIEDETTDKAVKVDFSPNISYFTTTELLNELACRLKEETVNG